MAIIPTVAGVVNSSFAIADFSMLPSNLSGSVFLKDLSTIPFAEAWDLQRQWVQELIDRKVKNRGLGAEEQEKLRHYLLFCEHPHVYTLGRNGDDQNLLLNEEELNRVQATYYKINRGGDITYHGYGQLVGYPILDLEGFFTDVGRYVRSIEEVVIRTVAEWGVVAERLKGEPGVWIDSSGEQARKICAVGIHLSRWVTMHGFALNVNTDLSYFNYIVPCGIRDKGVTSLAKEIGNPINMQQVKATFCKHFEEVFDCRIFLK